MNAASQSIQPTSEPVRQHSPLPWRPTRAGYLMAPDGPKHEVQVAQIGNFFDKQLLPFNRDRWQADLDLIVEAVNSHATLKARAEELEAALQTIRAAANCHGSTNLVLTTMPLIFDIATRAIRGVARGPTE